MSNIVHSDTMGRSRADSMFGVDMMATMAHAMGEDEYLSDGSDGSGHKGSGSESGSGSGSAYSDSSGSSSSSDSRNWSSDYSSEEFTESSDSEDEEVDPNDKVLLIYRKLMAKAGCVTMLKLSSDPRSVVMNREHTDKIWTRPANPQDIAKARIKTSTCRSCRECPTWQSIQGHL